MKIVRRTLYILSEKDKEPRWRKRKRKEVQQEDRKKNRVKKEKERKEANEKARKKSGAEGKGLRFPRLESSIPIILPIITLSFTTPFATQTFNTHLVDDSLGLTCLKPMFVPGVAGMDV